MRLPNKFIADEATRKNFEAIERQLSMRFRVDEPSGGSTVDTEARASIAQIIEALRALGHIL